MKLTKRELTFPQLAERFLNNDFHRFFRDDFFQEERAKAFKFPAVNIKESDHGFEMAIIAPGINKEDLNIQVKDNMLHIAFSAKEEDKQEGENWIRTEFRAQSFKRSFHLDEQIDAENIAAKYENGILNLRLPKKETAIVANRVIEIA